MDQFNNPIDLTSVFQNFYTKGLYTDHQIIFKDAQTEIPLKVHRIFLMASCPYFEKIFVFEGKPIENPLTINVEDALMAQKLIECLYGIKPTFESTTALLSFMIMRDFFSLGNNYENLLDLTYDETNKDLLLRVLYQFEPNGAIAVLLNKTFLSEMPVDNTSIALLKESGVEISDKMANLMIENSFPFFIIFHTSNNDTKIWNINEDSVKDITPKEYIISKVAYSYDSKILAILAEVSGTTPKSLKLDIWDTQTSMLLKTISAINQNASIVCISKDNSKIAISDCTDALEIWDWNLDIPKKKTLKVNMNGLVFQTVVSIFYSSNPKYFIVAGVLVFHIYDADTLVILKKISRRQTEKPEIVCLSKNGKYFAYTMNDKMIVLNLPTFQQIISFDLKTKDTFGSASYSPDSKKIIMCHDAHIKIWDTLTGKLLETIIPTNLGEVKCIEWPDNKTIIVGTDNGFIHVLDALTHKKIRSRQFKGKIRRVESYQNF